MSAPEIGKVMGHMRRQIRQIRGDLDKLGEPEALPEMIHSTNILRANEHLAKSNQKKSELLVAYEEYSGQLENLVSSVFEIQEDLKGILREQSALMARGRRTGKKPRKARP